MLPKNHILDFPEQIEFDITQTYAACSTKTLTGKIHISMGNGNSIEKLAFVVSGRNGINAKEFANFAEAVNAYNAAP